MKSPLSMTIKSSSLIRFAIPTIIASVFMSVYTTVDGIFVSKLIGTSALSVVSIVMPFLMAAIALAAMIGTGGSAYISAQLGEQKDKEARENFSALPLICFGISVVMSTIGLILRKPVLVFLGADEGLLPMCEAYAIPIFLCVPFAMLNMLFETFFITEGRTMLGMCVTVAGGIINIVLDWLLIAVFDMGISGAAIATGIGYSFPSVIGLVYFAFLRKGTLNFVRPKFRAAAFLKFVTNGVSEMVTMLVSSVITIVVNNVLMRLAGEDGVAAIAVILRGLSDQCHRVCVYGI